MTVNVLEVCQEKPHRMVQNVYWDALSDQTYLHLTGCQYCEHLVIDGGPT